MPQNVFSRIYLHLTWHTKGDEPLLSEQIFVRIRDLCRSKCLDTSEVLLLELGGMATHIHLAIKIPPTLNISKWIGELKGFTSFEMNKSSEKKDFGWQTGYGIVSFGERDLNNIIGYIKNQSQHHAAGTIRPDLEKTSAT